MHKKNEKKQLYIPPRIEIIEIVVEKGFAASPSIQSKAGEWTGTEELEWD